MISSLKKLGFHLCTLLLFAFSLGVSTSTASPQNERPNIILIMADDMGYSDIGCYGGEIETPNLDRLAKNGLRYSQFYNGARCCPTRASLLTGLYAHQAGMGGMEPDWGIPGYRGNINRQCVTMAEALKVNGYSTYMSGKWHLTNVRRANQLKDKFNWPLQRGFDRYYGTIAGAGSFFTPNTLTRDNEDITEEAKKNPSYYYTDAISIEAAKFISEHAEDKKVASNPFFLYVSYTAPHWPLHAKDKDIEKYKGRYDNGWDVLRKERFERLQKMGLATDAWKMSKRPHWVPDWEKLAEQELPGHVTKIKGVTQKNIKRFMAHRMAIYAAMIDSMDQGIGKIIQALEKQNKLENTMIVFLADNGGCAEYSLYGFTNGRTADIKDEGKRKSFTSYGGGWANASNTPFRYFKHDTHEGGISTPLIVHWPKGIQAKNEWRHDISHIIDLMPTFLEASNSTYPKTYQENKIQALEGLSLVPTFKKQALSRKKPLFWEHHGNRAVRDGKWKLVARGEKNPWELYNIEKDRSETQNLASEKKDLVEKMAKAYLDWAQRCHVETPSEIRRLREANKKKK